MATNFPTSLDSLINPISTDTLDSPDHAAQHQNINDAVEALETKVGIDNSTDTSSLDYLVRSASPVGAVMQFAGTSFSPPSGWLYCDGSAVSRTTYSDLYAVIGTTYGSGDGSTTFNLPNTSGRVVVGLDLGDSHFNAVGNTGGSKTHTLSSAEIPSHSHSIDHDHGSVTSGSGGASHTHSIDPPSTTSSTDTHGHSGTFGSSSHRHNIQIGLHDYWYKAAGANAAMDGYGLSNYGISWADEYILVSGLVTTVNSNNQYASASHRVHGSIGQSNTPSATASVSNDSHNHTTNIAAFTSGATTASHTNSVDLPNFAGSSGSAGSDGAHNNLQPYIVFNWIIKAA